MRTIDQVIRDWGYPMAQVPTEELALELDAWKDEIIQEPTINKVAEFHKMTMQPILLTPQVPPIGRAKLRIRLLREELNELEAALDNEDVVEVADALADLQYVLDGTYLECGMGSIKTALFDEVHRSNMTKSCTESEIGNEVAKKREDGIECTWSESKGYYTIVRNDDGKILKPSTYSPANLKPIVFGTVPFPVGIIERVHDITHKIND